jgi:hypothetical protein
MTGYSPRALLFLKVDGAEERMKGRLHSETHSRVHLSAQVLGINYFGFFIGLFGLFFPRQSSFVSFYWIPRTDPFTVSSP